MLVEVLRLLVHGLDALVVRVNSLTKHKDLTLEFQFERLDCSRHFRIVADDLNSYSVAAIVLVPLKDYISKALVTAEAEGTTYL